MSKKKHIPNTQSNSINSSGKRVAINSGSGKYYHLKPSWRFRKLDREFWPINESNFSKIEKTLRELESMTWEEILSATKSGKQSRGSNHHSVPITNLIEDAQKRLCELNLDDYDKLISIRLGGKVRVWGIMDAGVLMLLWFDENHQICPSIKN